MFLLAALILFLVAFIMGAWVLTGRGFMRVWSFAMSLAFGSMGIVALLYAINPDATTLVFYGPVISGHLSITAQGRSVTSVVSYPNLNLFFILVPGIAGAYVARRAKELALKHEHAFRERLKQAGIH